MDAALPRMPLPVLVNLETSLACNLSCVMCAPYLTGSTRRRDTMTPELMARVETQLLPDAVFVGLTVAGEPLMDRGWRDHVALAERAGVRLVVHSNGTLIKDDADLRRLLAVTQVMEFSVDATTPDTFASIRGHNVLPRILDNIRTVVAARAELPKASRPRLGVTMVLMRRNIDQLPAMVDLAHDLGVDSVGAVHLTVFADHMEDESLRHCPDRADRAFAEAERRAAALGLALNLPPRMDGTPPPKPGLAGRVRHLKRAAQRADRTWLQRLAKVTRNRLQVALWSRKAGGAVPCNYLQHRAYVSVGGDVSPCCMPGRPVAGNLLEQSFEEIWNGPVYTAMRQGFIDGRPIPCCAHCSVNRGDGYDPSDLETVRPSSQQLVDPVVRET